MTTFEDLLAQNGKLVYKTKGRSMQPMLRQDKDLVFIQTPSARLKKFDVALYRRGKKYVLHRVIAVKDGCYLIRGDNTFRLEHVADSAVIGVLTAFRRNGKEHSVSDRGYLLYVHLWNALYPVRHLWFQTRRSLIGIAKKLGILQFIKRLLQRS